MKKIKKLLFLFTLTLSFASVFPVYAAKDPDIEVYSDDIIEYKFRFYNGTLQYRRWNATKGYWIDATWLNVY